MKPIQSFSKSELYILNEHIRFRIFHSREEFEIYEQGRLIGSAQKSISGNVFGPMEYTLADGSKLTVEGALKPKYCIAKIDGAKIYPHNFYMDKSDRIKMIRVWFLVISQMVFFMGFWSFTDPENGFLQLYGKVNFAVGFILLSLMYLIYQKIHKIIIYLFLVTLTIPFFFSLFNGFHILGLLYPVVAVFLF